MDVAEVTEKLVLFKEVAEGNVFISGDAYYMRTVLVKQDFRFFNVVKLSDGSLSSFKDNIYVVLVNGSFQRKAGA